VKVGCFDFPKQNVFDLTGAERRVGCHTDRPESGSGRGKERACEKYHKRGFLQDSRDTLGVIGHPFDTRRIHSMTLAGSGVAILRAWPVVSGI
jgi:hypothetical protein